MCGICGVVQLTGEPREPVPLDRLDAMTDVLRHRGPDDRGTHLAPGIALGARRLSIVDVGGGHQPVASEDGGVVAVQNGELYNHAEIREELRGQGHVLTTRCDTEVLPHLYERDGVRFPERLRGKFAIAIWDDRRRKLVLARDRLGVKPLYWARAGDVVLFASELKSVLASGLVRPELDLEAIDLYMTLGYIPGPRTPLMGVSKLAPGAVLEIGDGAIREERYWEYPRPAVDAPARSLDEYVDELLELLREAVRDRLMSDVPLGAMLSGGLDSSLVVALMAETSSGPVETFSVGFREDEASELEDARRVAATFGCTHHELELSVSETALDLDELTWHLDEPIADLSTLGFDLLCQLAAGHVTVALAGQGADELFGGYPKHRAAAAIRGLRLLPGPARRSAARVPWPSARLRRASQALAAGNAAQRLIEMSGRLARSERSALYRGALADVDPGTTYSAIEDVRDGLDGDPLTSLLYLDARLALVDHMLLYFDKASMAHSLEVRVPYLDHRVVEWAARVPSGMKVRRGVTKRVLKEAGLRYLPPETVHRRKLGFFRFALDPWLRAQLAGEAGERLRAPDAAYRELLDADAVDLLVTDYRRDPSEDRARLVFAILMLESWLSSFVGRAVAAPASSGAQS